MIPVVEPLSAWAGRSIDDLRAEWNVPELTAFEAIGSTNDYARARAEAGAAPLTTVIAEAQSAGRGRFGRVWDAPAGTSLLISFVLRPATAFGAPSTTPLRVGLAAADAIDRASGLAVRLKWPNDVVAPDGRKLGGVLCEAFTSHGGPFVIAGIGINANQSSDEWAPTLQGTATSLRQWTGREVDRARLAGHLVEALRSASSRMDAPLDEAELARWYERDTLLGRAVEVDRQEAGIADGITAEGALRLRTPAGSRIVWSGTGRPADQR